jgi:hypothetical protein
MPKQPTSRSPRFWWRVALVGVAWLLPLLELCDFSVTKLLKDPAGIVLFLLAFLLFFPFGLGAFVRGNAADVAAPSRIQMIRIVLGNLSFCLAHVFYIIIVIILLWTPNRKVFWTLYVAMLIILALNVQGCRMISADMGGPHGIH